MGNSTSSFFGQPPVNNPAPQVVPSPSLPQPQRNVPLPPHSSPNPNRPLKRARPPTTEPFAAPAVTNPSPVPQPATEQSPVCVDDTPDGDSHRYMVVCESLYWNNRKQVLKIISKVPNMPPYTNLQKAPKSGQFIINFPNAACTTQAIHALTPFVFRSKPFRITPAPKEQAPKRLRFDSAMKSALEQPDGQCLSAADVTAKLRTFAYDDQVSRKQMKLMTALQRVFKSFRGEFRDIDALPWMSDLLHDKKKVRHPLCCPLVNMLSASGEDLVEGRQNYRNKTEFTIGMSPASCGCNHDYHVAQVSIGFSLGHLRKGHLSVGPVDGSCVTTSLRAIDIAQLLTPIVATSGLPVYDRCVHTGFWRQVIIRESLRFGGFLVIVGVKPVPDTGSDEERAQAQAQMVSAENMVAQALRDKYGENGNFGLFWQTSADISGVGASNPIRHVYGIEVLHERVCGLKFRIQPTAFFQVNTVMAEKLYELIGEVADIDDETVVLDLCCGTGTIGLSMAKRAHSVVGIELIESAVEDARHNAALNGITNATFVVGKVEDKLHDVLKMIGWDRKCVVVLDPPRAGVPNSVLSVVRGMRSVLRVVYVSCKPENLFQNALALCRPTSKAFKLEPFRPIKAYGVDLFPHTENVEMVTLFERDVAGI